MPSKRIEGSEGQGFYDLKLRRSLFSADGMLGDRVIELSKGGARGRGERRHIGSLSQNYGGNGLTLQFSGLEIHCYLGAVERLNATLRCVFAVLRTRNPSSFP